VDIFAVFISRRILKTIKTLEVSPSLGRKVGIKNNANGKNMQTIKNNNKKLNAVRSKHKFAPRKGEHNKGQSDKVL
jgi:hypothetical protein